MLYDTFIRSGICFEDSLSLTSIGQMRYRITRLWERFHEIGFIAFPGLLAQSLR